MASSSDQESSHLNKVNNSNRVNGVITDFIHINDRAIHYGDGIFETILCSNRKLYYWKQHYQRLQSSALRLNLNCPDEETLLGDIRESLAKNPLTNNPLATQSPTTKPLATSSDEENTGNAHYVIKIILSRGAGDRGYKYSDKIMTNRFVMLSSLEKSYSSILSEELLTGDLFCCKTQVSINESLAGIKHLNRLENVLASNEWKTNSNGSKGKNNSPAIDGLMLNANKQVIECTMSNIFAINENRMLTPKLNQSGVQGIMRDQVLTIAEKCNVKVSECDIQLDELMLMDSLFISNSLIGIKSITSFNKKQFQQSQITNCIFDSLLDTKEDHVKQI